MIRSNILFISILLLVLDVLYAVDFITTEKIHDMIYSRSTFSQEAYNAGLCMTEDILIKQFEQIAQTKVDFEFPPSMKDEVRKNAIKEIKPIKQGDIISFYNINLRRNIKGAVKSFNQKCFVVGANKMLFSDYPEMEKRFFPEDAIQEYISEHYDAPRNKMFQIQVDNQRELEAYMGQYAFVRNPFTM